MRASLFSQWTKIVRRNVVLGTFGASGAFAVLSTALSVLGSDTSSAGARPSPGPGASVTRAVLEQADGIVYGVGQATQFLGIVAIVLFASALASEYSYGTLRNLLVREPRRLVLLGGSVAALIVFVAAAALVATIAGAIAALTIAPSHGLNTSAWTSGAGLRAVAAAAANVALAMIGFGLIGGALGLLLRSPVAAIGIGVAYVLPIETIVRGTVDGAERWMPGTLLSALAQGGTETIAYGHAALVVLIYALLATVACARAFAARDVGS